MYLANFYFYNYKPSPRILRQYRVLRNVRKNKDIVITKPDKGNGVVILDRKLYNNAIEGIIPDTSKFEKLNEDPTLKREASRQRFLNFLNFLNNRHRNIKFTIEKQNNHSIAFLDVLISGINNQTYHTSNILQIDLYRTSLKL